MFCAATLNNSELAYFRSGTVSKKVTVLRPKRRELLWSIPSLFSSSCYDFLCNVLPCMALEPYSNFVHNYICKLNLWQKIWVGAHTVNVALEECNCRQKRRVSVFVIPSMRHLTVASRNMKHDHTVVFCTCQGTVVSRYVHKIPIWLPRFRLVTCSTVLVSLNDSQ